MRIKEIIVESFGENPYSKTTLPLSDFRGLHDPLNSRADDDMDATVLWDRVEDLIDAGVQPHVMPVKLFSLYATQDWLSSEASDEVLFDGYDRYPVVLEFQGVNYILDGHNRVANAIKKNQPTITVYLFGLA